MLLNAVAISAHAEWCGTNTFGTPAANASTIKELKHDLAADGFCLHHFYATESAFLAVPFTSNLLSLYQHQNTPEAPYRQPGTLRVAVFRCGAVLGVMGRDVLIKLSEAWGG